ncbi:MAG TPA: hypothetical protein VKB73_07530 [Gaiellaceae bacterium]|nr:hypothetical protein [Gaiellaceae bacterium]
MVGTVRAARHRATARAGFAVALAVGAVAIFGALGLIGELVDPGRWFLIGSAVVAGAAALADLAGLRVRPQLHFQVPEPWRRTMPLPRALFLYGLLLGTGLTTFVPAVAAWALLPLTVAVGLPGAIAIGLSFAAGRAAPVLLVRDEAALAERPHGLRAMRVLAAASLVLALAAGEAQAATKVALRGGDPSAAGTDLVWQQPGVGGVLLRDGGQTQLPGNDPALGGTRIAWHDGDEVTVADSGTLQPILQLPIPGVEKLAVSDTWLVYRVGLANGKEQLRGFAFADPTRTTTISAALKRGALGRPSLSADTVLYHVAGPAGSALFLFDLATSRRLRLRSSAQSQVLNPDRVGSKLLYVRLSRCDQELRLGPLDGNGAGRVLYKLPPLAGQDAGHEPGHTRQGEHLPCGRPPKPTSRMLWTTALSGTTAYVTVLRPGSGGVMTPSLLAISR